MEESSTRLVDYFVIAGYNHATKRGGASATGAGSHGGFTCQGTILQRFPSKDWPDTPFIGKIRNLNSFSSDFQIFGFDRKSHNSQKIFVIK